MGEYISITDFAKKANVSRQTVYRRIDKDLKGYIVKEGHKIKINEDAIFLFSDVGAKNEVAEVTKGEEIEVLQKVSHNVRECNMQEKSIEKLVVTLESMQRTMDKLADTLDKLTDKPKQSFWQRLISRKGKLKWIK